MSADLFRLVEVVLKVTIVLGAAALAARVLSRRSAAARHQVWAIAIAASLATPLLALVAPQWTVAVLPTPTATTTMTVAAPFEVVPSIAEPDVVAPPIVKRARDAASAWRPEAAWSTQALAAFAWLAGVMFVLGRFAFGTLRVWWIVRRATPAVQWVPLATSLAASLGIHRRVTFLRGDHDTMPMALGVVRARILLPADADNWPLARQRVVLLHELAHVRRRDCLTQLLSQLACAAHWFNPLIWLAARRLRAERERACDDLVLAAGTRGSDYADHLLDIARSLRSGASQTWAAVTMAHRSQLEGRLMAILDPALSRRSPTRASAVVFSALALTSIVVLAGARPVAKSAEAAEARQPAAAPASVSVPAVAVPDVAVPAAPVQAPARPAAAPSAAQGSPSRPVTPTPAPTPTPTPTPTPAVIAPAPFVWNGGRFDIDQPNVRIWTQDFVKQVQKGPAQSAPADPKIVAALTAALKDEDGDVRQQALNTLVRMRAPLPPDVVTSLLKDKEPDVRQHAVHAVGQLRDPKYAGVLAEALKDEDADVRKQAAFALGHLRDAAAVTPLLTALKDADPDVRQQAAFALGQLRDPRAVDPLIAALKDVDADVRRQAVFALGQIR